MQSHEPRRLAVFSDEASGTYLVSVPLVEIVHNSTHEEESWLSDVRYRKLQGKEAALASCAQDIVYMEKISFRRATHDDCRQISRLHYLSHTISFRPFVSEIWLKSRDLVRYERNWGDRLRYPDRYSCTWVANETDEVVGIVSVNPGFDRGSPDDKGRVAMLLSMHVHPRLIGKGVGCRLMEKAVSFMRMNGFSAAYLEVIQKNQRARRFYETAGWALFRLEPTGVEGEPIAIYRIDLGVGDSRRKKG